MMRNVLDQASAHAGIGREAEVFSKLVVGRELGRG